MSPKDYKTADKTKDELDEIHGVLPPDDSSCAGRGMASTIVSLVEQRGELFHDKDDKTYVEIELKDIRQTFLLGSKQFKQLAGQMLYEAKGKTASRTASDDAMITLAGIALYEGRCRDVSLRVAKHKGDYLIDLCDDQWRAVRVNESGWKVMERPEPTFRRTPSMRSLPVPVEDGDIGELVKVVNIDWQDFPLLVAVILEAFRPDTPYPVLELCGEQGSAKSTTQRRIRSLIDPSAVNLRAEPGNRRDLMVGASQNHVVSLNNLSHLSVQVQDALCSLSTGGGYAARTLFSDLDETLADITRPVIINGIAALATRPDLVDRTIRLMLPPICPEKRRLESDLDQQFEAARGQLFGALLDTFVTVLNEMPSITLSHKPRMADFAILGEAVCRVLGWDHSFREVYGRNRRDSVEVSLASSPVIEALLEFMSIRHSWEGPPGKLLDLLKSCRERRDSWPNSGKGMGDALRRHRPALQEVGISVTRLKIHTREGDPIRIENLAETSSQTSQSSPERLGNLPPDDPTNMIKVAV